MSISYDKLMYAIMTTPDGGDIGFDVNVDAEGACRGRSILVKRHYKLIVANDNNYRANDNFALAA